MALPGVLAIETAGLKAWPGIEVERDGGWVLRAANGYTKRANSVQSLDPDDDKNAGRRILAADSWFRARNLPPVFRQTPLAGPAIVAALDDLGWVQVRRQPPLRDGARTSGGPPARATIHDVGDPVFLAVQQTLQGYDDSDARQARRWLAVLAVPACGIVLRNAEGDPVATALMAIAGRHRHHRQRRHRSCTSAARAMQQR